MAISGSTHAVCMYNSTRVSMSPLQGSLQAAQCLCAVMWRGIVYSLTDTNRCPLLACGGGAFSCVKATVALRKVLRRLGRVGELLLPLAAGLKLKRILGARQQHCFAAVDLSSLLVGHVSMECLIKRLPWDWASISRSTASAFDTDSASKMCVLSLQCKSMRAQGCVVPTTALCRCMVCWAVGCAVVKGGCSSSPLAHQAA